MQTLITIEKWTPIEVENPGRIKTSAEINIHGKAEVVQELIELLKAAGYTIT